MSQKTNHHSQKSGSLDLFSGLRSAKPSDKNFSASDRPNSASSGGPTSKLGAQQDLPSAPLAFRMRPQQLDDFLGQQEILASGKPLSQWIKNDSIPSLILWGPPGCGKTTLAMIIAKQTQSRFVSINAVMSGVKDLRTITAEAEQRLQLHQKKTTVFIDEIHRFNKSQQDALLPHVESGVITLIGATTENPSFELNSALLSRCRVLTLKPLEPEHIKALVQRALDDPAYGLHGRLQLSDRAIDELAARSLGDARHTLSMIESLWRTQPDPERVLEWPEIEERLSRDLTGPVHHYDKSGDEHYNVISAFIKSLRDSDAHAGLYYLARMLEGGEDPKFIARRMIIFASEDIGNADPRALQMAVAVKEAIHFVGMPECRINLAQGVTYLASAPKSNASYRGIEEALAEVRKSGSLAVPAHLKNAPTSLMKDLGYGKGYRYAHDYDNADPGQSHLPEELKNKKYYRPTERGLEKHIKQSMEKR